MSQHNEVFRMRKLNFSYCGVFGSNIMPASSPCTKTLASCVSLTVATVPDYVAYDPYRILGSSNGVACRQPHIVNRTLSTASSINRCVELSDHPHRDQVGIRRRRVARSASDLGNPMSVAG
ncbi:hypothetical protein B296_00053769 [Ensete ventricosum]|uniref:Uncharacterized protein n=1 Tax=Ensete ventricosum TaxID=4639 RepID=A0A426X875_ENSVE|nr:hypothetical protein B296_00053769 [Ensete ventricosum]